MQFDRRTFIKGTAAGIGASALLPGSGGAKPPSATIDDRLDTDDGPREVIVVFRTNEDATLLDQYELPEGYYRFEVLPMAYTIATGPQIESLARRQSVRRITPNYELDYFNHKARTGTNAETVAEELGYDGTNGHAAVVDTGIDALHPDHQINLVNNYQWVNPLDRGTMWVDLDRADSDNNGHGSHVSGTVAGDGSADADHRGMAPRGSLTVYSTGATLLIVNSLGAFDHLLAEKRAGHTNVQAVNNSFGSLSGYDADYDPSDPTNVASYHLYQEGILPVFAAGNCGPDGSSDCLGPTSDDNTLSNPAQSPWVLGVAATDKDGKVTGFSSRGRKQKEDTDRIQNWDRELALENYEEYRRSLQAPPEGATEEYDTVSGSGVVTAFLIQTADTFALEPSLDGADGFFVSTTLTWSPSTGAGAPEPSEFEFELVGPDGTTVASAGSNYIDRFRDQAELTLETYLPLPDASVEYELEVTCYRGGGEYQVTGDVFAVDAEEGIPEPEPPYSIERPSVGAPGAGLLSTTMPGDQLHDPTVGGAYYSPFSGTSMAAPVVTGIVTLLNDAYYEEFEEYPDVLEVIDVIEATAEEVPDQERHQIGDGFINAEAAVEELLARGRDDPAPTITRFELTDQGDGPNTNYRVDWTVSDGEGDLHEVTTELVHESGRVVDSTTSNVDGETAEGHHTVRTRAEASEVALTATDAAGNSTRDSKEI